MSHLKSMTAFARSEISIDAGTLTWELRSVNHRYMEPNFRIPDGFREIEPKLRESLRKKLARGKLDCSLKWQAQANNQQSIELDDAVLSDLSKAITDVRNKIEQCAEVNPLDILAWPGVRIESGADKEEILGAAVKSFQSAVETLCKIRADEGAALAPLFDQRLDAIDEITESVRTLLPSILENQNKALLERFENAKIELEPQRLEQEMVMLAQKADVAEELDRLDTHVKEVRKTLRKKEPVGRRLDFLMQELNREANTLSSKAIVTDTTQAAVELKVLIEQMREQVQNIE